MIQLWIWIRFAGDLETWQGFWGCTPAFLGGFSTDDDSEPPLVTKIRGSVNYFILDDDENKPVLSTWAVGALFRCSVTLDVQECRAGD